jgi:hypothetical protein
MAQIKDTEQMYYSVSFCHLLIKASCHPAKKLGVFHFWGKFTKKSGKPFPEQDWKVGSLKDVCPVGWTNPAFQSSKTCIIRPQIVNAP